MSPSNISLPAAAIAALHSALAGARGATEGAELARRIGFSTADAFHGALEEQTRGAPPSELDPEEFWLRVGELFASMGWGDLSFEQPHPGVAALSSADWAEANGRRSPHPSCHLTTGLLSGLLSRVAGTGLAVMEVECRAAGGERCRFLLGSPAALEEIHGRLRAGAAYGEALASLG